MPYHSPKHKLTRTVRGWVKRINHKLTWICGATIAPTGVAADDFYEKNMTALWQPPAPTPAVAGDITVKYLADAFYDRKLRAGRNPRTLADYRESLADFVSSVGRSKHPDSLQPADFATIRSAWANRFGPDRLSKSIINVRTMFKWGRKPPLRLREPDYGDEFDLPSRKDFRADRKQTRDTHGKKLFTETEIADLLSGATPNLKAMILLALNAGFGNTDVAELPLSVIDLATGWLDYARGKTGIDRRVPLWPETIKAIKAAMSLRAARLGRRKREGLPIATDAESLLFITRQGRPYIVDKLSGKSGKLLHKDRVATAFNNLCQVAELSQFGRGFYSLRRTHRTIADEVGDSRAANLIMGHATDSDMGGTYVLTISDERLVKVVDHVKDKLGIMERIKNLNEPAATSRSAPHATSKMVKAKPARRTATARH